MVAPSSCPAPAADAQALVAQAFRVLDTHADTAHALALNALALTDPESTAHGLAQHALGMSECMLGRLVQGRASLLQAAQILNRHGPKLAECHAWRDYGSVLTLLCGDMPAGIEAIERALALAADIGDPVEEGAILARIGPAMAQAGRPDDARRVLRKAITLLAGGPDRNSHASALGNLGFVLIGQGDYAGAVTVLREERPLRDPVTERTHAVNCEANLAVALAGTGQAAEARALIEGITSKLDARKDGYQWADYLLSAGRVSLLLGDPRGALHPLRECLDFAREKGMRPIELDVLAQLSTAEERCGDAAAALAYERALRLAEREWLGEKTAQRVQALEAGIELATTRAENAALERSRSELEDRVQERTAALQEQIRERQAADEQARFLAQHDFLTRLPNRRHLQASLSAELARAEANAGLLGVLFVDLDGFKAINDAHGHLAGDRLLRVTARRLQRNVPEGAIVTRFGGDEFVVLVPGLVDPGDALVAAQRLRSAVLAPLKLAQRPVGLSCSIGVAIGPRDARVSDELLRRADRAMLAAKAAGRNQVVELDIHTQDRLDRRGHLRRELGQAIGAGRLSAAFQPIWDVRRHTMAGFELLARWHDPELGWVSPSEFIPVAEESGLIGALGLWAVREAVHAALQVRRAGLWRSADDGGMRVSVNVSTVQLSSARLVDELVAAVAAAGGEPDWIELELTESAQLAEDPVTQQRMRHLREAGFTLAIDDFGAGFSSFNYLNRSYFDRLKIDRGLVSAAMQASDRSAVVGSIVVMAHRLGLDVVAEGIETAEQFNLLAEQGCDAVQGFGIARPMSLDHLLGWRYGSA